jgi:hypothetical protein
MNNGELVYLVLQFRNRNGTVSGPAVPTPKSLSPARLGNSSLGEEVLRERNYLSSSSTTRTA